MLAWRGSLAPALLALGSVFASLDAIAADKGVAAYRWVDENGVVHYGDHIPPKYATQESTLYNKNGVAIGRTEAQKTAEEIAEDEKQRQALLRQKQHDAFLLTTYTSVKDIESLRDERLVQISSQRRAAEQYIEGLHSRLNGLQSRAQAFRPYSDKPDARRMPDDLAEDLVRTLNEMRSQRSALAAKDAEENALRQEFEADIVRYRELKKPAPR
jgi:uncharacterized protein DUF4124